MLPADEDYGKAMLTIFHAKAMREGESMRASQVENEFLNRNFGRLADYRAALKFCAEQGWLRLELDWVRLTKAGHAEF
jgi:hypothetical protein